LPEISSISAVTQLFKYAPGTVQIESLGVYCRIIQSTQSGCDKQVCSIDQKQSAQWSDMPFPVRLSKILSLLGFSDPFLCTFFAPLRLDDVNNQILAKYLCLLHLRKEKAQIALKNLH
jgi:hypothetical protein